MKEIISEQEIKKFNYYGSIYTVHLAVLIISAVPLFMWLGRYAYIPFGILFIITIYWALKVEKLKKKNDIQTYKEIVAFTEGKKLDELHKAVEVGKRPYQNILKLLNGIAACRRAPGIPSHMGYRTLYRCGDEPASEELKAHLFRLYGIYDRESLEKVCMEQFTSGREAAVFPSLWG